MKLHKISRSLKISNHTVNNFPYLPETKGGIFVLVQNFTTWISLV